ncbi:MAG: M16 family metallopeptidase [Vicinamibacterales bacterium]
MIGSAGRVLTLSLALCAGGAGVARAQVADWPADRPPRPLPARDVKFPPYAMRTLSNGLQVVTVSHHEQPVVSLRLLIRAGGAQDPEEKPGVAALAASLLDQGTATRTAEQIQQTIDSIGGAIGSGSGTDLTFVNAVVMKDSFDLALDLVSDIARNAAFAPNEIELQRKQTLSGLTVSYEDPEYLAGVVFDRLVFGFHPYGRPDAGTPESIQAITREDLVKFHKSWFGANNAVLAIVGDIAPDQAFAGAERVFGSWGPSTSTAAKPVDPPPPTRRLVIVDRPGAVQTEIRAGHIALPRKHPDYLALDLAIKILGGEGGNRLHRVLRSERGLTYGASADLNALKNSGNIVADTDTRSDSTAEALRLLVDEMWRLQRQRVSERELADAQAYLTGSFPLTIETPSAIALQVLNAVFYGLDLEELQTFRERVNAITVDDIQRVARTYLQPDRLSIVLVGDASLFEKQLAGLGFDRVERISVTELDLRAADLRRKPAVRGRIEPIGSPRSGVRPASLRQAIDTPAPASLDRPQPTDHDVRRPDASALIERAVRAKGGAAKLKGIQTIEALSDMIAETPQGRITVPTTIRVRYPAQFRMDSQMPAGPLVQVFDRGRYWVEDGRGVREVPGDAAESMRQNVVRDHISLLLALQEGRLRAHRAQDVSVDGTLMPALVVDMKASGPLMLVLDPETALIVRQRYGARGAGEIEESLEDYRSVDGLQVAFSVTVRHPAAPPITRVLRSFQYNVPLDASIFTRPS